MQKPMKRKAFNEDADPSEGPSKISKGEPQNDRLPYTSKVQSSAHGFDYQQDVALLLLLRATLGNVRFSLAYEMTDATPFDDVVFIEEDNKNCLLIQVKHSKEKVDQVKFHMLFPSTGTKACKDEDFSLFKYLKSYPYDLKNLPAQKHFIIFTNKQLKGSKKLERTVEITDKNLAPESILCFNDSTEKPKLCFNVPSGKPIRFKPTPKVATEMMNYVNKEFAKNLSLTDVTDFFEKLTFLFEQPELRAIIKNELFDWLRTWIHPIHLGKANKEDHVDYCLKQLVNCLENDSVCKNDEKKHSKVFLTLEEGKECLAKIQRYLSEKNGMLKYDNSALAMVEDYYIGRYVRLTDTSDDSGNDIYDLLTGKYDEVKIIVLTAKPGMGKSALFHHVSFEIQKSTGDLVFFVCLNNIIENLKQPQQVNSLPTTLQILKSVVFETNLEIIREASENDSSNGQRIRMFLDGFDEIAPMYVVEVIQMIEYLKMISCIQIIVSGRRHVEYMLREKFKDAKCLYLMPFSKQNQKAFLKKRWKISENSENNSKFNTYSTHVLDEFDSCINNRWCDFLGIPLMIKMFADVKKDDFELFLGSNEEQYIGPLQPFTAVGLYEAFIKNSMELKSDKLNQSGCYDHESKEDFFQKHQLLAVHQLECEEICPLMDDPSMTTKLDEFVQKIKEGKERSPLVECVNGEVQFIHRSYAEYVVSKYLYDNIDTNLTNIKNLCYQKMMCKKYDIIMKFLLNMIEQSEQVHFKTIYRMCKIDGCLPAIFQEGCLGKVESLIKHNSSFVNNFSWTTFLNDPKFCQPIHNAAEYGHENILHMLIEKGANINAQSDKKLTPLHCALKHEKMVQLLLSYSANVNAQNCDGETPLHEAIKDNQTKVAKMIIKHQIDNNKITAVNLAARFGKISILRQVLNKMVRKQYQEGCTDSKSFADACKDELKRLVSNSSEEDPAVDVNFEDFEGKTPLHYASETTQLDMVRLLLKKSKCVNLQDIGGKIPLHYAAKTGQQQIFKLLLKKTEDAYLQDFKGKTPLHYAAEAGHHEIVEVLLRKIKSFRPIKKTEEPIPNLKLLSKTEDVDLKDSEGMMPLHYASKAGHDKIVELLLKKTEDVEAQDLKFMGPLQYASEAHHHRIVELFLKKSLHKGKFYINGNPLIYYAAKAGLHQIVEWLFKKQLKDILAQDVNSPDYNGKTYLDYAAGAGLHKILKMLLKKSPYVHLPDHRKKTPLHYAAERGHQQIVELLLNKMENVNIKDFVNGRIPLHYAAEKGHQQIVQLLLKKIENVNLQDFKGKTPLHYAAEAGYHEIVEVLLSKTDDVDLQDSEGMIPLHYASKVGHDTIVKLLLEESADAYAQDKEKNTPLLYAAEAGHHQIVELLLKILEHDQLPTSGSESASNSPDRLGKLPIHYAAKAGNYQIVELLLGNSEYVNIRDNSEKTPLHYAVEAGHQNIVELLLKNSADVNLHDHDQKTSLQYAAESGHQTIVALFLKESKDLNLPDNRGRTALHYAAEAGLPQIQEILLKNPADVNVKDAFNRTPLLLAAKAGKHETVEFLFNKSEDFNLQDTEGGTLLHYTAKSGHIGIVSSLLENDVVVDLQDNFAKTPLHYAAGAGHEQIVSILLKKSKNENLQDLEGKSPLHHAAEAGHYNIVDLMVNSENVLPHDNNGRIPLHYAVKSGQLKIVNLLIEKSANVDLKAMFNEPQPHNPALDRVAEALFGKSVDLNLKGMNGMTLLHYAVKAGNQPIFELFLEKWNELDFNSQDNEGKTALHFAAKMGQLQIVELLIGISCDINLQDFEERTALHYMLVEMIENRTNKNFKDRDVQDTLKFLLEKSADINIQDIEEKTPLHYAVYRRELEIVEWLLKQSVDVNLKDNKGRTALHYAPEGETFEHDLGCIFQYAKVVPKIVELLLGTEVDVNIQDIKGKTPLHHAAQEGAVQTVTLLLLSQSVNVNLQDTEGRTPLHYAATKGYLKIVKLLLENSGDAKKQDCHKKLPIDYARREGHQQIVAILEAVH